MATQQGTVSIELALQGLAVVERGLDSIKKSFGSLGQDVKNLQKDFDSVGKGLNTVIKDLKRAFTEGGFNKLKDQFKESVSTLKTALPMMLRGSLLGFASTVTSSIAGIVKKAFTALPKQIISQLTGIYNTVKSITGFDQFFNASGVLQGSISLANYTKTLKAQSDQTAIDIQQMLNLRTAMELVGVESDNLGKRVSYMGKQLTKAFGGSAPDTLKVLKELGITESMIAKMDTAQRFTEIANSINKLSDPAKQARAAIMLFDRAGNELLPFFRNFAKSTEDAQKILGDLPNILNKNQQSFVRFSNAITNLQIKRQQFFAGFLDVAQEPFNTLLDKVLSLNFTSFGQKVADNFKNTLNSIKAGDLNGFIENFSLEFSTAFEKGFDLFINKLDTLNLDPMIDKFVEVGEKVIAKIASKSIDIAQDITAGVLNNNLPKYKSIGDVIKNYAAETIKNPFLGAYKVYASLYVNGIAKEENSILREQQELRIKNHEKELELRKKALKELQEAEAKALKERYNANIDVIDKIKQDSKQAIEDSQLGLMIAGLQNNAIQSNPYLSDIEKAGSNVDFLQKRYAELEKQILNTVKASEMFGVTIESEMAPYLNNLSISIENIQKLSKGFADSLSFEVISAIKNFVDDPNKNSLTVLKDLIPTDQFDSFVVKLKELSATKTEILNQDTYLHLSDSIQSVNDSIEEYKNNLEAIISTNFNNDLNKAAEAYDLQQAVIGELDNKLEILNFQLKEAQKNNDTRKIRDTAKEISNLNREIAQLNAQPNPLFTAKLNNIMLGYDKRVQDIEDAISVNNASWLKTNNEKIKSNRAFYESLIKYNKEAIDELIKLRDTVKDDEAAFYAVTMEIQAMSRELLNLNNNLNSLGADPDNLIDNMRASFTQLKDEFGTVSQNLADGFTNSVMSMRDSFSDFMYDVFRGAKSGKEALDEMWLSMGRTALRAITDTISNFIMQHTVMTALEYAFSATTIALNEATNSAIMAENSATAAAMAEMWKPSAIWASIASMGGAVAVGLAAMAGIMGIMGGFASGGRVRGGKQISWLNEEGSEFVVSARSPLDNDKWLEAANRGVNLDDLAIANAAFIRQSESQQSNAQPQTVKQITVRTSADIRREWKEGGLIEFVRSENLRRGWAS